MPVSPRLLEMLVCPVCMVKVELKPDSSGLKCPQCKRVYPIQDDFPVMLANQATIEE
ncbi:MAG TPA: Trm112 family protein [Blastocatellia bacterium]|nr:Trm112 family protein [Blastocatellia bacterium]